MKNASVQLPTGIETRPYQQRVVAKSLEMFGGRYVDRAGRRHEPAQSVMIESPTGSGKTIMGLLIAAQLQAEYGYRIGWVAMRRNLLAQAAQENRSRGFDLDVQYISMFDKDPPRDVELLVIDEAQHDAAMSMARLHGLIRPAKVLGLTATPYRTDRIKLCFQHVIHDVGIQQLIEDGYLAHYHHYTIPEYTPQSVANFYARQRDHWGKSLLFFHRTQQCRQCQQELARHDIASEVVTGQSNRERQLADFAAGKIKVLISMAILAEGFDCPSLQTVFCRPSGKACTIQMGGRVFREYPELAYKQIVQCQRTRHPFLKTATPVEQYTWAGDRWRALKLNRQLADLSVRTRQLVASRPVELPELVTSRRPQRRRFRRLRGL